MSESRYELRLTTLEESSEEYADSATYEQWRAQAAAEGRMSELVAAPGERRAWPLEIKPPRGAVLKVLLARFGGWTGTMTDPAGTAHEVSLEPWRDCDPDSTYIQISFVRPV